MKDKRLSREDFHVADACLEDDLASAIDAANALFDVLVLEFFVAGEALVHLLLLRCHDALYWRWFCELECT